MTNIEKATEELNKFMVSEWNESESDYFETTEPYVAMSKCNLHNKKEERKYQQLLRYLTENEKEAWVDYQLKLLKRKSLEFVIKYEKNSSAIKEFEIQNLKHAVEVKNPQKNFTQN